MSTEGILGLAPTNKLSGGQACLFLEKLAKAGIIKENLFSVSIGQDFEEKHKQSSKIMIGGYDLDRFAGGQPIMWHKIADP